MTVPDILSTAEQIRQRKLTRAGLNLNFLILGENGIGKRSFLNTLCGQQFFDTTSDAGGEKNGFEEHSSSETDNNTWAPVEKPMGIETYNIDVVEKSTVPIHLRVSIVQNLGFNIKNSSNAHDILLYIENEYQNTLDEEMKVKRNPKQKDYRLHAALYLIRATDRGLSALDIEIMKAIGHRVNLIPMVGKADAMTERELEDCKQAIRENIASHGIEVFDFVSSVSEGTRLGSPRLEPEELTYLQALLDTTPFSIISSNDGSDRKMRHTPWGSIPIHDADICDFVRVQNILFGSHIQELKDTTISVKYEKYRIDKLQHCHPPVRGNSL